MKSLIYFVVFLLSFLVACTIEEASKNERSVLRIASNVLDKEEYLLFDDFAQKSGVQVEIIALSTDSIIKLYKKNTYNSGIDAVLMNGVYNLNQLSRKNVLEKLPKTECKLQDELISTNKKWISLGVDPYVISGPDSSLVISTYNHLAYGDTWKNSMKEIQYRAFVAGVLHRFGARKREKAMQWITQFKKNIKCHQDSIPESAYTLVNYSHLSDSASFRMPNQSYLGAITEHVGFGVVRNSPNAYAAKLLLEEFLQAKYNQKLANSLHVFPFEDPMDSSGFSYQNDYPKLYKMDIRDYLEQERTVQKITFRLGE